MHKRSEGKRRSTNNEGTTNAESNNAGNAMERRVKTTEQQIRCDLMRVIISKFEELKLSINTKIENVHKALEDAVSNVAMEEEEYITIDDRQQIVAEETQVDEDRRSWKNERTDILKLNRERLRFANLDCELSEDVDYALWRDKVVSEISSNDCLFIIDRNVESVEKIDEKELSIMKQKVRSFIIRHLDQHHHRLVKDESDPAAILEKLDQKGDPTSSYTEFSLMRRLIDLRYEPTLESATQFISKFDDLVGRIRRRTTLSDQQAKVNLMISVEKACPSIQLLNQSTKGGLSIEEIKTRLFEEENQQKDVLEVESSKAMFGNSNSAQRHDGRMMEPSQFYKKPVTKKYGFQQNADVICFKCGKAGHFRDNCDRKGWKCYNCNEITTAHFSADCPLRQGKQGIQVKHKPKAHAVQAEPHFDRKRKTQKMKKIPFTTATQINKRRRRNGIANLAIKNDSDTESLPEERRLCWVDGEELDQQEEEMVLYASSLDEGRSREDKKKNKSFAFKDKWE